MIALATDCLVFEMPNGTGVPFSADMISVELCRESPEWLDEEFLHHAANAVFHYFRHELGRDSVTMAEFANAFEKVIRGFTPPAAPVPPCDRLEIAESDLGCLARESGAACELFFFPRLRDELRHQLQQAPRVLRFRHLRDCVKLLSGTRRWTPRCRDLEERIVDFLRECLCAEGARADFALVVE